MKKTVKLGLALLSLITLTNLAHAAIPGAYVGFGLGGSRISGTENLLTGPNLRNSNSVNGFAGRAFVGYNVNRNFGIEGGYARYAQAKYTTTSTVNSDFARLTESFNAFDLVGKAYLPIQNSGFNVYALAGAARVNNEEKLKMSNSSMTITGTGSGYSFNPIYGAGVSYEVSEHVTTNLEFSHVQFKDVKSASGANLLTLNVAYNFG